MAAHEGTTEIPGWEQAGAPPAASASTAQQMFLISVSRTGAKTYPLMCMVPP